MISVIIPTPDDDPVLIETLAALVAGIADGVLRDAVIVGPASTRINEMAEAAGATRIKVTGSQDEMIIAAAKIVRADYCFVIAAGCVPIGHWTGALAESINRLDDPRDAGLFPLAPRAGLAQAVKSGLINQFSLWSGRPHPRHGFLAARKTLEAGTSRFRFFTIEAAVSDRRIHSFSR